MPTSFTVSAPSDNRILGPDLLAEFEFRVGNASGFTQTARTMVESSIPGLTAQLLSEDGRELPSQAPEIDIRTNDSVTYRLRISATQRPAPGTYRFNLLALNTANPDGDVARSQSLCVIVPVQKPPTGPVPQYIIFTILGALIAIGGAIAIILAMQEDPPPPPPPKLAMPKLEGLALNEAETRIRASALRVGSINYKPDTVHNDDSVVSQDPKVDHIVEVGDLVNLIIAQRPGLPPTNTPEVKFKLATYTGRPFREVAAELQRAGLRYSTNTTSTGNPKLADGLVIGQAPPADTLVDKEAQIQLTVNRRLTKELSVLERQSVMGAFQQGVVEGSIKRMDGTATVQPRTVHPQPATLQPKK